MATDDVRDDDDVERGPSDEDALDLAALDPLAGPYMNLDNAMQRDRLHARLFDSEPEPRRIGRWVIVKCVGRGGSGAVYLAYDPKLDRRVAVKCLRVGAGMDEDNARQRVVREAQAMAKLSDPNVVHVYDVSADAGEGEVYVVMEYIEGATLRDWQKDRSLADILDGYEQAGRGLVCLHGAGLVHRDIKPDNILVAEDKDKGEVRVVVGDLGLVHAIEPGARTEDLPADSDSALDVPITREGTRLGTWQYMAPEQLRGESTDARSDQFAFCVSLYEAVCRVRPFARAAQRTGALLTAIERGALEPPQVRVSSRLMRVVQRGLAPQPEHRFDGMDALLRELRRARRKRWPWGAGIAVIALAVGLLGFYMTRAEPATEPPTCAAQAERKFEEFWQDSGWDKVPERIGSDRAREVLSAAWEDAGQNWIAASTAVCDDKHNKDPMVEFNKSRDECLDRHMGEMKSFSKQLALK